MTDFDADRYKRMKYRFCGNSGLQLPLISLGFWQSLGQTGREEVCRDAMFFAFDHGITHFDIANNYGDPGGHSEEVVGKYLKEMPRDELIISTKAGHYMWPGPYGNGGSRKYLLASLDQSLKRLDLDYVDIFYMHRFDSEVPQEETMAALDHIVRQGKALYVGVSGYSGAQFARAAQIVKDHDWAPLTIHQPYYHMFSRGLETDLLPIASTLGAGLIPFCPLAGGLISERYLDGLPPDSRLGQSGDHGRKWWDDNNKMGVWERVRKLKSLAEAREQTLTQMVLAWTVRQPEVTSALIGASSVEQIKENLGALKNLEFSKEELTAIDEIVKDAAHRQW